MEAGNYRFITLMTCIWGKFIKFIKIEKIWKQMVETTPAEQSQTAAAAASSGTTAIPEFKLPEEMTSLHDLRLLHKATEEIIRVRS